MTEKTAYIDAHRAEFGVEPICRALEDTPAQWTDFIRRNRDYYPDARGVTGALSKKGDFGVSVATSGL